MVARVHIPDAEIIVLDHDLVACHIVRKICCGRLDDIAVHTFMFIPVRKFMTCCADDMKYYGYPCKLEKRIEIPLKKWLKICARFEVEFTTISSDSVSCSISVFLIFRRYMSSVLPFTVE